ncbi:hypothetical protein Bpfe_001493, partial [Biomphalaria pfeifferi]
PHDRRVSREVQVPMQTCCKRSPMHRNQPQSGDKSPDHVPQAVVFLLPAQIQPRFIDILLCHCRR